MSTLKDIPVVEYQLKNSHFTAIKALYKVCFGNEGPPRVARRALRNFSGFGWDKESGEHTAKIQDVKLSLQLPDAIAICNILGLQYNGSLEQVVERICFFLIDLQYEEDPNEDDDQDDDGQDDDANETNKNNDDDENDENDEIDENGENDENDENDKNEVATEPDKTVRLRGKEVFSLTFRDVEDSIRTYDGQDDYPVRRWVEDFEEIADVTEWNELQKLIFAKKSLKGLAKLYVQSLKGIKTWSVLKKRLIEEFDVQVNSAQIHKLLMSRKKKYNESVQEYALVMREIGSRASIEEEVVIQYIIEGITDDSANKIILYGARTFAAFKEKIKTYEAILKKRPTGPNYFKQKKENERQGPKVESKKEQDNERRDQTVRGKQDNCFNCGVRGHKSRDCPDKNKGTKCFTCNKFGHVASQCPSRTTSTQRSNASASTVTIEVIPKNYVKLNIGNAEIKSLFDTGSDISAIRQDVYEEYLKNITLTTDAITLKGIGNSRVRTLGSFCIDVNINDEKFELLFHVIPTDQTNFRAIIGSNLLEQADVQIREDGVIICKRTKENFLMKISVDDETNETVKIDVQHIENLEQRSEVAKMISEYKPNKIKDVEIQMKILLKNEEPIHQRPRRLSIPEKAEVEKQISEWLNEGIIRESSSDYASPIVLVKKKDGRTRICCDYRKLNKNIIKDRFPLPLIEDVLDKLEGAMFFSTIDLRNGFFHVPIEESSVKYTSFITHNGQFEFLKCPFGLCNSPAVFQRYVSHIFRPLTVKNIVIYYMDDIIIPSSSCEEGIEKLKMVLEVARDNGLDIKVEKCQLLKRRVSFLGFIIENGKIQPSEEKTVAIKKFPEPTTIKQIQSFLGLTGYFRKFIPSYSIIAKPLSDMMKKDTAFKFGDKQRIAFQHLKDLLSTYPVLHIFQRGRRTELHTDASMHGYGACLMQKSNIDSKLHPIYFMSRKTTPAEEKYTSYELEVLSIIQAVKKFRIYLLGSKFKIVTDCAAFQKTMQKADLTTRVARWALLLEEYDYEIEHRRGNRMPHVDALSRYPIAMMITTEDGVIQRIKLAQENDETIRTIKKILESQEPYEDYVTKHDILYKYDNGEELVVIPRAMQSEIIKRAHEIGHFSVKKTGEMIRKEFYIPKVQDKIQKIVENCVKCILGNRKEGKKEGMLHPIPKQEGPLHTYHVDHLGPIPSTNKNYQHIFAVIDEFTKFTWLHPTKSTTAKEVINCLNKQQTTFGNPSRIISDRGSAFTANEFKDYCAEEGIAHVMITTGVARGNGQIERINRTIIPILTKLSIEDPTKWYKHLNRVQIALNSTHQRSINKTPFEVLIGVKMKNKEDIQLKEMIEEEARNQFDEMRENLRKECKESLLKIQNENRKSYNLRRKKPREYQVNDLIAIKRTQFGGGLKLKRKYLGPYEITKVKDNDRYDVVKIGNHEGPLRTSTCAEFMKHWIENESGSESEADR